MSLLPIETRYLVYDCEVRRPPPVLDEEPVAGIEYATSWQDFPGMGIACVCAYDAALDEYRAFGVERLGVFEELARERGPLVSWNGLRFDDPLLAAAGVMLPDEDCRLDLYALLRKAVGSGEAGLDLDTVARATLGEQFGKRDLGGRGACVAWQAGRPCETLDYCLRDVWLLKRLYDHARGGGDLETPVGPVQIWATPTYPLCMGGR